MCFFSLFRIKISNLLLFFTFFLFVLELRFLCAPFYFSFSPPPRFSVVSTQKATLDFIKARDAPMNALSLAGDDLRGGFVILLADMCWQHFLVLDKLAVDILQCASV